MGKKMIVAKMIDSLDRERRELNYLIETTEEGDLKDYFNEALDSLVIVIWKLDMAFPTLRMKN